MRIAALYRVGCASNYKVKFWLTRRWMTTGAGESPRPSRNTFSHLTRIHSLRTQTGFRCE